MENLRWYFSIFEAGGGQFFFFKNLHFWKIGEGESKELKFRLVWPIMLQILMLFESNKTIVNFIIGYNMYVYQYVNSVIWIQSVYHMYWILNTFQMIIVLSLITCNCQIDSPQFYNIPKFLFHGLTFTTDTFHGYLYRLCFCSFCSNYFTGICSQHIFSFHFAGFISLLFHDICYFTAYVFTAFFSRSLNFFPQKNSRHFFTGFSQFRENSWYFHDRFTVYCYSSECGRRTIYCILFLSIQSYL